jgi:hypothetical protein
MTMDLCVALKHGAAVPVQLRAMTDWNTQYSTNSY